MFFEWLHDRMIEPCTGLKFRKKGFVRVHSGMDEKTVLGEKYQIVMGETQACSNDSPLGVHPLRMAQKSSTVTYIPGVYTHDSQKQSVLEWAAQFYGRCDEPEASHVISAEHAKLPDTFSQHEITLLTTTLFGKERLIVLERLADPAKQPLSVSWWVTGVDRVYIPAYNDEYTRGDVEREYRSRIDTISKVVFKPGTVKVADFAMLCGVISRSVPRYNILLNQCYWFAWMIHDGSKEVFRAYRVEEGDLTKRARFRGLPTLARIKVTQIHIDTIRREFSKRMELANNHFIDPPVTIGHGPGKPFKSSWLVEERVLMRGQNRVCLKTLTSIANLSVSC
ncbi:hypothetical protein BJ138DRAFT_1147610 [Hygrophoropsis aurantiaca]|uniref:Uncharacterized protein n=1 Tax=Hygrophoropsis aurantiaca TaxID=72124 RepID=A0ACB8AIL6_9AGAM|nr:hypothetical protein BJ138DRAFT_1147610 [Hygrophoropsis aurantiaca]